MKSLLVVKNNLSFLIPIRVLQSTEDNGDRPGDDDGSWSFSPIVKHF
jgi:hypothetical protein